MYVPSETLDASLLVLGADRDAGATTQLDMESQPADASLGPELESLIRARLGDWRQRLIDLSFRNRLIHYQPTKSTTLQLTAPSIHVLLKDPDRTQPFDFFLPPELDADPEVDANRGPHLVATDVGITTPRPDEIVTGIEDPKRIKRILDNLARRSKGEFEDKALRILHLAVGFLTWEEPTRRQELRSPLVLVPVELKRESVREPYRLYFAEDEEIVINPALTLKLERDAGITVPEDWAWEEKSVAQELDEIRRAVVDTGWSVDEQAVLGLFSFQKMVMYRDLLLNEGQIVGHSTVRLLAGGSQASSAMHESFNTVPREAELDSAQDPRESFSILDSDASQRRCIEAAKRGCSFVMQGPPGTGKSQTIANIIAEALGEGKQILFISEKIAALDVVHKRLASRGLDDFCLKLHGRNASRREVVGALHESLTEQMRTRVTVGERDFERLVEVRRRLNDAVEDLHRASSVLLGKTLHEVYAELAQLDGAPAPDGAPPASALDGNDAQRELNELTELVQAAEHNWSIAIDEDFVWRDYRDTTFSHEVRSRLLTLLEEVRAKARVMHEVSESTSIRLGLPIPVSSRDVHALCDLGRVLQSAPLLTGDWLRPERFHELKNAVRDARAAHELLTSAENRLALSYPGREPSDFDGDIDGRCKGALHDLKGAIGWSDSWEQLLVERLPQLAKFANHAEEQFGLLERHGHHLADLLGQPWLNPTTAEIERLIELANLAFNTADRPDERWLVPAGLKQARSTLEENQSIFADYQTRLAALRANYSESVLQLNIGDMVERIEAHEGRRLAKWRASYRADAKALKNTRKDG